MQEDSDLNLAACTLRDHAAGIACGVWVTACSRATVGADCVFARNAGGGVLRPGYAPDAPPEMSALCGKTQPLRPSLHQHVLTYTQANARGRSCDVCRSGLTERSGTYQCSDAACDFDSCVACFDKGAARG